MKYARYEYERRFLLSAVPPGQPARTVRIHDRYISSTRVRLRRMDQVEPFDQPVFKLTQKVPADDGGPGAITTIYLSEAEYEVFAAIPATPLTKIRQSLPPYGIDVFEGELAGLILAEIEFETEADYEAFKVPDFAVAEVTADRRFTGGQLAATDAAALRAALQSMGVNPTVA
jgi:CYTH domain-containing protein